MHHMCKKSTRASLFIWQTRCWLCPHLLSSLGASIVWSFWNAVWSCQGENLQATSCILLFVSLVYWFRITPHCIESVLCIATLLERVKDVACAVRCHSFGACKGRGNPSVQKGKKNHLTHQDKQHFFEQHSLLLLSSMPLEKEKYLTISWARCILVPPFVWNVVIPWKPWSSVQVKAGYKVQWHICQRKSWWMSF